MLLIGIPSLGVVGSAQEAEGPLADGDPVTTWTDSSGNGNDVTQTGGARPIFKTAILNSLPVVRFTAASSQYLNLTTPIAEGAAWTVIAVMKSASTGGIMCPLGSSGHDGTFGPTQFSDGNRYVGTGGGYAKFDAYDTSFHVVVGRDVAGTATCWVDGTSIAQTGGGGGLSAGDFDVIGLRGSDYSGGDIAEVLIYNSALTTDRANIEKYLGTKYAITVAGGSAVDPSSVTGLQGWWEADSLG